MLEMPGVTSWRGRQVNARSYERKFVRCEFAEQHRATGLEFRLDDGVLRGDVVDQQLRMAGGADAGRGVDVLEGVGNAVHCSLVDASLELAVGAIGVRESSLPGDEDEGVQQGIERGN